MTPNGYPGALIPPHHEQPCSRTEDSGENVVFAYILIPRIYQYHTKIQENG